MSTLWILNICLCIFVSDGKCDHVALLLAICDIFDTTFNIGIAGKGFHERPFVFVHYLCLLKNSKLLLHEH